MVVYSTFCIVNDVIARNMRCKKGIRLKRLTRVNIRLRSKSDSYDFIQIACSSYCLSRKITKLLFTDSSSRFFINRVYLLQFITDAQIPLIYYHASAIADAND